MLDYLARLDFDCIMCLGVFMKGADAVKIKQKLGDRKSFWTGLAIQFTCRGTRPMKSAKPFAMCLRYLVKEDSL